MHAIRSFVAVELAGEARAAVGHLLAELREDASDVAWTKPENLHVTLKFLGGIAADRVPALAERLAAVAGATPAFTQVVEGIGAFPSVARPRVLWVGTPGAALADLAAAVDDACAAEGFPRERRPFHGHVTLGRVREPARGRARSGARRVAVSAHLSALLAGDGGSMRFGTSPADRLVLFQSELSPRGSRYTPLASLALASG